MALLASVRYFDAATRASRLLTEADTAASTAAALTETFGIATDRRDFLLFFHQYFVEAADGFIKFLTQACGALVGTFLGKLSRAASSTGACYAAVSATTAAARSTFGICRSAAAGSTAAVSATFRHLFRVRCRGATAQAFTGLSHASDTAR